MLQDKPEVIWKPQAGSQEMFLTCPLFEVLYEGTRGPGKTDALLMDFCQHVGRGYGAGWKGILFRQTYKQLTDVISKTKKWFPQIWPTAKYNATEHHWVWPEGETLLLRQFARHDDYWNYHGHEYPWVGWEELCNWADDVGYKRMMSTCRSSEKGIPRRYRATTNPYGPGHNWVKARWRLPQSRGLIIRDSLDEDNRPEAPRIAIHGHLLENKILLDADPGYMDRLRGSARNEAELKAWMEGSWDIVAGGMFDDLWDPKTHVIPAFPVPHSWRIDRSFDWGSSAPFSVGWWAESDGTDVSLSDGKVLATVRGDLFRIAEWYGWRKNKPNEGLRMLASDVAKGIVEREILWGIHGRVKAGPADTAIYTVENGRSIAMDMAKPFRRDNGEMVKGVHWTRADKRPGSRKTGWEMLRRALSKSVRDGKPREEPGIFIFENCTHFMRTVPVLPRDEKDLDDVDTKAEDHVADEARYRVRAMGKRVGTGHHVGMF